MEGKDTGVQPAGHHSSEGIASGRRQGVRRAAAVSRHVAKAWPLLLLAAINAGIIFFSNAPAIYSMTVAVGTLGVAIVMRASGATRDSGLLGSVSLPMRDLRTMFWSVGCALHLFLLIRVLTGPTSGCDIALWVAGIAAFGAPLVHGKALKGLTFRPPVVDAAMVAALMLVGVALHSHDLRNWYYAAIGDEIGFYLRVREILEEGIRQPFALQGVYHNNPMLNSVYQASVSWLFGGSAWGWKFSSVVSVAVTVPAVYGIGSIVGGRTAGIAAAGILVSSHYLMAFTHTGYNHLDATPVTAWAALAFMTGTRKDNAPILFASGVIAGLALYTTLSARVAFPLFIVWIVASRMPWRRLTSLWPTALGVGVCTLPFLAQNGLGALSVMGLDTISPNSIYATEIGIPLSRIADNLSRNPLAWWWNDHMSHYTSGSLLDRASGILAITGIGAAVGRWRAGDKMLLAWLAMTMIAAGMLSPYPYVPITRMHSNILPLALLSGVGVSVCWGWVKGYRAYKYVGLGALLLTIVALNVWRFQVTTPNALHHYPPESLAIRAWQSDECGRDDDTLFVGRDGHLMDLVLLTYIPEGERPKVVGYEDPLALEPRPACLIFFRPEDPEARQTLDILSDAPLVVANPRGYSRVEVITP